VIFPQIKPSDGLGKAFMTRLEIAALACKILALWVVVQIAFLIEYAIYFVIMFVTAAVQKGKPLEPNCGKQRDPGSRGIRLSTTGMGSVVQSASHRQTDGVG
jgi:hypothetical protein